MAKTASCGGPCSVTDQFVWDTNNDAGLPLLLQDSHASFIYGPGGMLLEEITSDDDTYFYHQDQQGSVRVLSDANGNVANAYTYDAYGQVTSTTGDAYNPFGYTGEYTDKESGLIYLRARYYEPSTQQFLSVDPIVGITGQPYAYTKGNPTNLKDPTGLWSVGWCEGSSGGAVYGGGVSKCWVLTGDGLQVLDVGEQLTIGTQWGINLGITTSGGPLISNATRLGQLEKGSEGLGGSIGTVLPPEVFGAGADFAKTTTIDDNGCSIDIYSLWPQVSLGVGTPWEVHYTNSQTATLWGFNIPQAIDATAANIRAGWLTLVIQLSNLMNPFR